MLGFADKHGSKSMTLSSSKRDKLTEDEWKEMAALKNAINERPSAVHPDKMEEFTQYLVRSMREMGG